MSNKINFNHLSYRKHESYFSRYVNGGEDEKQAKTWLKKDTVDYWRHMRMYKSIDPLLKAYPDATWLTVGDGRYGNDAHYILEKGLTAVATDITDLLLKEANALGFINDFKVENAEKLSFNNEEFDFILCKESYHHFPRPMIALYEMLRVAKKGVVLIEPNDGHIYTNFIELLIKNTKNLIKKILNKKIIKHGFEESGNYCYSISKREIEKVALGMNFKVLAFKGSNDHYENGVEYEKATTNNKIFKRVKKNIFLSDLKAKVKLQKYNLLTVIIFKEECDLIPKDDLKKAGYDIVILPDNPYI